MGYSHADSVVAGRFRGCLYCTPPGFAEATYAKWLGHSEAISRKHFVSPTDEEFSAAVRCRQESIPKIVPLNSRATKACTMTTSMSHHSLPEYIKSTPSEPSDDGCYDKVVRVSWIDRKMRLRKWSLGTITAHQDIGTYIDPP